MNSSSTRLKTAAAEIEPAEVADLLGGPRVLGSKVETLLDVHDLLCRGLPTSAKKQFCRRCPLLAKDPALDRVLGGAATSPGRGGRRAAKLNSHQSGQLWRLAHTVINAALLFGEIEAAEQWLLRPAFGIDRRRPLDLLETPAGIAMVFDHLLQLEFGVYI